MGAIVRLQWQRYPRGFRLVDYGEDHEESLFSRWTPSWASRLWLVACDMQFNPDIDTFLRHRAQLAQTYVLEGTDNRVFLELANVQPTREAALAFANRWGLLEDTEDQYEMNLARFLNFADVMKRAVNRASEYGSLDPRDPLTEEFSVPLQLRRGRLRGDSTERIFLSPATLFEFCCAEFLQLLDGGVEIRKCPRCGTLLAVGKVGKPPIYCSDACRVAMHRKHKRAREARGAHVGSVRNSSRR